MLINLAGAGAATALNACGSKANPQQTITTEEVQAMAKAMTRGEVPAKDAEELYNHLQDLRFSRFTYKPGEIDPTIQPCLMFDPEVDLG
jgi:hypothetical protein